MGAGMAVELKNMYIYINVIMQNDVLISLFLEFNLVGVVTICFRGQTLVMVTN